MKVLLIGSNGKMGKEMQNYMKNNNISFVGVDKQNLNLLNTKQNVDIVVDYSNFSALNQNLNYALKNKIPIVVATTNHTKENLKLINDCKNKIPILMSSNFSFLFNFLLKLLKNFNAVTNYDFSVIETHHKHKKDSPSGSCKMILKQLNKFNICPTVNSVRVGEVVGKHEIFIYGKNEMLNINHSAFCREVFCEGTIKACKFLLKQQVGLYSMENVIDSL